jgi:hypothetical protein
MQAYDLQVLAANLNALCEVFDKKPVPQQALKVWFDTLKEFQTSHVMDALIGWPKGHPKFPTPSEVWKLVNERSIREREEKARHEKKEEFHPGVGGRDAQKFLAQMRDILRRPAWSPQQHWERVLATAPKGLIGYRYAKEVLDARAERKAMYEREPGQDDEEKAVGF